MISLSLRPTGHPPSFQPRSVRSSTRSYPRFNLPMGSSLSFGSTAYDSNRPIRTRFRFGSAHRLTLPQTSNSPARYAKSTRSQNKSAPTACRHAVSGTISLPFRGTFHLSLTVLVRYRSPGSIQAYRVVPTDSHQISRARCYLGFHYNSHKVFVYGILTLYDRPFQTTSTNPVISYCWPTRQY